MWVVKHWNRLPREVADASSLETFKVSLDGALNNLMQLKMSLFIADGLNKMTFKVSFQPKIFYGLCMSLYVHTYAMKFPVTTVILHTLFLSHITYDIIIYLKLNFYSCSCARIHTNTEAFITYYF